MVEKLWKADAIWFVFLIAYFGGKLWCPYDWDMWLIICMIIWDFGVMAVSKLAPNWVKLDKCISDVESRSGPLKESTFFIFLFSSKNINFLSRGHGSNVQMFSIFFVIFQILSNIIINKDNIKYFKSFCSRAGISTTSHGDTATMFKCFHFAFWQNEIQNLGSAGLI